MCVYVCVCVCMRVCIRVWSCSSSHHRTSPSHYRKQSPPHLCDGYADCCGVASLWCAVCGVACVGLLWCAVCGVACVGRDGHHCKPRDTIGLRRGYGTV